MSTPEPGPSAGRPAVSVAMATYRGEAYVVEQVRSILDQLGPDDELVVVDDASTDATVAALRTVEDPRVRLEVAERNRGYVATFERALRSCRHDLLLLADQDDVWPPGRVDALVAGLAEADVVAGNLALLGSGRPLSSPFGAEGWELRASDSTRHARNVVGVLAGMRPYYGCAMGLRRAALDTALPFPGFLVESHDLWLALVGNLRRSTAHVPDVVVLRREHDTNQTPNRPRGVVPALRSRLMLVRCVVEIVRRRPLRRRGGRPGARVSG